MARLASKQWNVTLYVEHSRWEAYQQDYDHPHEDLLQVPQIFNALQQGCCASKECVLACLLNCECTWLSSSLSLPEGSYAALRS